jgi:hypothetical protein
VALPAAAIGFVVGVAALKLWRRLGRGGGGGGSSSSDRGVQRSELHSELEADEAEEETEE